MFFTVNSSLLVWCIAIIFIIPSVCSFDEFLKDEAVESTRTLRDLSNLADVQAEYEELMAQDASVETTTQRMCQLTGTCGFQEYTEIDERPGSTKAFHRRCFCPEGLVCVLNMPPNMVMRWWRYTCELPPTTKPSVSTEFGRRLGSFGIHTEL